MGRWRIWTQSEDMRMFEDYPNVPKLMSDLDRSKAAVMQRAQVLGLAYSARRWKQEEIDFVRSTAGRPIGIVARRLKRTVRSVRHARQKLDLVRRPAPETQLTPLANDIRHHLRVIGRPLTRTAAELVGSSGLLSMRKHHRTYSHPKAVALALMLGAEVYVQWNAH